MNKEGILLKKFCAIIAIISLLVSDFLFVGTSIVSYAIDAVTTSSSNVEFTAYFLDSNQNKTDKIQKNIDEGEAKLFVDVSVKKEGYFNGKISVENGSFDLKQEIKGDNINSIEENTVTLNQINAGQTVTVELGVMPKTTDAILNAKTDVKLSGSYVDSKNAKKNTETPVDGTSFVELAWNSKADTKAELESTVLTNSIYQVDGIEKRVVGVLVNSKITDNNYPVKNTKITLSVPENAKNVKVNARSTDATNKEIAFSEANYKYNAQSKNLTIELSNEDAKNVSWCKNASDTFVVTYEFDKDENILNKEIAVNSLIKTYDNKELNASQVVHIARNIDGAITAQIKQAEDAIYKGKIYTGEARDYTRNTQVNIDYLYDNQKIEAVFSKPVYVTENGEINSNIWYKEAKINKQEFMKLFGENGNIQIRSGSQVIGVINKETVADENGIITLTNKENLKNDIQVVASKPISTGTLNIETTETILNIEYSKDIVDKITGIKEKLAVNTSKAESIINLKDVETKATLKMTNSSKISTIADSQTLELEAVLDTADESKELFKNPKLTLTLPEETKITHFNVDVLNLNGLELDKQKTDYVANNKLAIVFNGEQKAYDGTEGTVIKITLDIKTDKLTPSKKSSIKLAYSNENQGAEKEETVDVELESQYGLMIYSKFTNYNNEKEVIETFSSEEAFGTIDATSVEKAFAYGTAIVNNFEGSISNVVLIGSIPAVDGEDSYKASLNNLEVNNPNAKITYSEKANISASDNSWGAFTKNAVSYKIEIPKMEQGEVVKLRTTVILPEKIGYNKKGTFGINANCVFQGVEKTNNSKVVLATKTNLIEQPEQKEEINSKDEEVEKKEQKLINIETMTGNNKLAENDTIYGGQTLRYRVTVVNNTGVDYSNVIVKAEQKNGYIWNYKEKEVYNPHYKTNSKKMYYEITDSCKIELGKIESFKNGETYTFEYEAVAFALDNKDIDGTQTYGTISVVSEDKKLNNTETTVKNKIKQEELQVSLLDGYDKDMKLTSGGDLKTLLTVKNTAKEPLKDVEVKIAYSNKLTGSISLNEENKENVSITDQKESKEGINVITLKIANIAAAETVKIEIYSYTSGSIKEEKEDVWILAQATTANNNAYTSNKFTRTIYNNTHDIKIVQQSFDKNGTKIDTNTAKLSDGDKIQLIATITNEEPKDVNVDIEYNLDKMIEIDNAKVTLTSGVEDVTEKLSFNNLKQEDMTMKAGEKLQIAMTGTVDTLDIDSIINKLNVYDKDNGKTTNSDLTIQVNTKHEEIIKPEEEEPDNPQEPTTPSSDPTNGENGNGNVNSNSNGEGTNTQVPTNNNGTITEKKTYTIEGTVFVDKDKDGKKASSDEKLKDIVIEAISLTKGKVLASTKTDASGNYKFTLEEGKYVLIYNYNNELYTTTTYKAQGVSENENSDAIERNVKFNGITKKAGITDTITLNNNIQNLDIGLVTRSTFDLKLAKYVSKITVTNKAGTKEYAQPENTTLAKAEIKAKNLKDSLVVIEYKIKVTNVGDVPGYAKQIVDLMPTSLNFNSKLNQDWYLSSEKLYNTSLANVKIEPGETKELTLVLTKTMTETNTGLINNKAEIKESSNLLGLTDEKNDIGSADVIISVSTGTVVSYAISTITTFIIIAGVAFMINKKYLSRRI